MQSLDDPLHDPALSWSQLRAFDACVRLASFNAAAAALSLTPAAVRHQIGLLETRLGAALFLRQGGRLAPTPVGADFAADIAKPLRALSAACRRAAEGAASAPITLTAPPVFARRFLMGEPFLDWCRRNDVHLDVSEAKRDLVSALGIAAIRLGATPHADLDQVRLLDVSVVLAAAPALATAARPQETAWWRAQTLLDPKVAERAWPLLWQKLGVPDAAPRQRLQFSSYVAALDAARGGRGLILAPLPFIESDLLAKRLVKLSPIRIRSSAGYDFVLRRELAATPRGRALRKRLVAVVKE
ncbi:MAG: LysR family transcriptional regulator [Pseudomonadota bacterium]